MLGFGIYFVWGVIFVYVIWGDIVVVYWVNCVDFEKKNFDVLNWYECILLREMNLFLFKGF